MEKLIKIMIESGAASASAIKYTDCDIINQKLADKIPFTPKSVCIGTIPYYTHYCDCERSVSSYALAYDYHTYINRLGKDIISKAETLYPNANFVCFGDHSPINEKTTAAKAGLGIIGEHSLLITPKHSSFVFLFEIISDIECNLESHPIENCEKCGKCQSSCPANFFDKSTCLSAITQKKGTLTKQEADLIKANSCVWGCDICQMVCPHTLKAIERKTIYTNNEWFNTNILTHPSTESIARSNDFSARAYSWRGSATILRNLDIIQTSNDGKQR